MPWKPHDDTLQRELGKLFFALVAVFVLCTILEILA